MSDNKEVRRLGKKRLSKTRGYSGPYIAETGRHYTGLQRLRRTILKRMLFWEVK